MMDWTDRHCRFFHRILSRRALLYTEMLTTGAVIHGDRQRLWSAGGILRFRESITRERGYGEIEDDLAGLGSGPTTGQFVIRLDGLCGRQSRMVGNGVFGGEQDDRYREQEGGG